MLKNIPEIISPDLMHALMSMGHGDEIVLADADFPSVSKARRLVRLDGMRIEPLLEAILPFFPLDRFVEHSTIAMDCSEWGYEPEAYERYRKVLRKHDQKFNGFELVKRFSFYERATHAYAVVATSESDGNLILKKGPVM